MISRLSHGHRFLRSVIALTILAQCSLVGFARAESRLAIEKVGFTVSGDVVEIRYDLIGPAAELLDVRLVLKRESDPTFQYSPRALTGDVNFGVVPAAGRRIVWTYREEFPQGLIGDDYYFVVVAKSVLTTTKPSTMAWLIGGALAIGAGVAVLLLAGQEEDTGSSSTSFPPPPGRPN